MSITIPQQLPKDITDKYNAVDNSFVSKEKEFETEIGDVKQADFLPQFKIKRWDNECNFSVRLIDNDLDIPEVKVEDGKIKYIKNKIEVHSYPVGELGKEGSQYEFEVILKEKPISNKLEFTIETKGLDFFKQSPLTQKDIDDGMFMPENVVGSYVVKHSTKRDHITGQTDYKTGKFCHIYYPYLIDANGWKVRAEDFNIDIENKKQTITILQDFLDNAVYPIRHASGETFGYTTEGGSVLTFAQESNFSAMGGNTFNLSEAGTLDSLHVNISGQSNENVDLFIALYREDSAGSGSHDLVASTESLNQSWTTSKVWITLTAASEVLSADDYILAALGNGEDVVGVGERMFVSLDLINTRNHYFETTSAAGSYATRKGEDPWTNTATSGARDYSIYATYTPSVSDPDINVVETLGLNDAITMLLPDLYFSVNETLGINEAITPLIDNLYISVTETLGLNEGLTLLETNLLSVGDTLGLNDAVTVTIQENVINVSESVGLNESVELNTDRLISINDGLGIDDSVAIKNNRLINVAETLGINEAVTLLEIIGLSVSDRIGLNDVISSITESDINVSDSLGVNESLKFLGTSFININDSLGLNETIISLLPNLYLSISDDLNVDESITELIDELNINVNDELGINEERVVGTDKLIDVSDDLGLEDSVTLFSSGQNINVSDSLGLNEVVTIVVGENKISSAESLNLKENITIAITLLLISVNDSLGLNEDIASVGGDGNINVNDGLGINESIDFLITGFINVNDTLGLGESTELLVESFISVSESLNLDEFVDPEEVQLINVSDSIGLNEAVTGLLTSFINVNDALGLDDIANLGSILLPIDINISDSLGLNDAINSITNVTPPFYKAKPNPYTQRTGKYTEKPSPYAQRTGKYKSKGNLIKPK